MESILHYLVLAAIAYCLIAVPLRLWKHRFVIRKIRGPPRPSFLLGLLSSTPVSRRYTECNLSGHEPLLTGRHYIGDLEMEWYQQYGAVYRTGGCFGVSGACLYLIDTSNIQGSKIFCPSLTLRRYSTFSIHLDTDSRRQGTCIVSARHCLDQV